MSRKKLTLLGVMTGTSCDALDVSWLSWHNGGLHFLRSASRPYPVSLRKRVLDAQNPGFQCSLRDLLILNRDLGSWYGKELKSLIRKSPADIIGLHGQTVAHHPDDYLTLQLGDAARVAQMTGTTVISDFRSGDLAAHGQGAPLVPKFHEWLAEPLRLPGVSFHNLGGISNLTGIYRAGTARRHMIAYDTGPANVWIDAAVTQATHGRQKIDRGGRLAASGQPHGPTVKKLLDHPYFAKKAPKSTGRDDFSIQTFLQSCPVRGADLVATATEITVASIVQEYRKLNRRSLTRIQRIYFCGGGALNTHLLSQIQARLPEIQVLTTQALGFDPQAIESSAFAFLAKLTLEGQTLTGPWTGSRGFAPPGQITPGANWKQILKGLPNLIQS